jgi:hypothetical protein
MLDAHPELAVPPETHFVPELIEASRTPDATPEKLLDLLVTHRRWADFGLDADDMRRRFLALRPFTVAEAIRAFYAAYAERWGKPRWGDKTPGYSLRMPLIDRHLPEARFIHLIRDGRDVRLSRMEIGRPLAPARHARRWKRRIRAARRAATRVASYTEVRYEDLVADPEGQLRRICRLIELDFDPAMLAYHEGAGTRLEEVARELPAGVELFRDRSRRAETSRERLEHHRHTKQPPRTDRVARWREEMSAEERQGYERVAGGLLRSLGYETGPAAAEGDASRPADRTLHT